MPNVILSGFINRCDRGSNTGDPADWCSRSGLLVVINEMAGLEGLRYLCKHHGQLDYRVVVGQTVLSKTTVFPIRC